MATIHEAGGLSSAHDVEIFRAWKRALPAYDWSYAEVDHDRGLTLFSNNYGEATRLHFAHAICGFDGTGPKATVEILVEAGFGPLEHVEVAVFNQQEATFRA